MIMTENLPLEGKIKIDVSNINNESVNFILKRNVSGSEDKINLMNLELINNDWVQRDSGFGTDLYSYINSVAYNDTIFVAVGGYGKIATSTNGETWTQQTSGFGTSDILSVAYGNNIFIAVGNRGKLSTSTDGITWTLQDSGFGTSTINSVAYGNGLWIIGGANYKLATSTDGITWTQQTSFSYFNIKSISYNNNMWIVSDYSTGDFVISSDGINWERYYSSFGTSQIQSIAYGNNIYVAGGDDGKIATSTDGITWTQQTSGFGTTIISGVAYNNNTFVAVGYSGKLATSLDGITWTQRTSSFGTSAIFTVACKDNLWIIGGASGKLATKLLQRYYLYDTYAQNNITYVYSLVPEVGDTETSTILSIYCNSFICDSNSIYKITDDLSYNNFGRERKGSIAEPFGRKYPIDHSFGLSNYTKGSIDFHLNSISSSDIISQDEITYRKAVLAFLASKGAKIIKDINGNIWLVALYNSFPQAFLKEIGNQTCNISTDFVTIGVANTQADLARAGMLEKFILYTE